MGAIQYKILVVAGKGGVGKSSVAAGLAVSLAMSGKSVGILDVDICGPSIPRLLNLQGQQVQDSPYGWIPPCPQWSNKKLKVLSAGFLTANRDTPIVWRGPRKTSLIKRFLSDTFWGKLDYLIIDTPPGTSDEHLSVVGALKASKPDGAIIITTPQDVSSITVRKEISFCKKMDIPILGIVENMSGFVCPCCNTHTSIYEGSGGEQLATEHNINFLGKIPIDPQVSHCGDLGLNLAEEYPDSPSAQGLNNVMDLLL
eukprot:CAMPEP_0206200392 /NCGR_PEP_ID=MMETSP0166-20121206/10859_1 /ASSEMBLY_ACC=CAM_ASM_000260 /TAXON_ID=95228 /ORGANISM="Vannella robusta, Strain DIVA3 518/3/11/1/6" /LENGTH=255 /DNA_ID=CAMNT_0053618735 /DNA_START=226 /DNA_END=990 /DNA_ORIENTATION=-